MGGPPGAFLVGMDSDEPTPHEEATRALADRRADIEARLSSIEAGAVSAASGIGFGKRVGEGTNIAVERMVEVSMHNSLRAELETVRRAQEKLARDETTGCDVCGKPIGAARLHALPWAVTCVECAP